MAAVCQIRQAQSGGRSYFEKEVAVAKVKKKRLLAEAADLQHRLPAPGLRRSATRDREDLRERLFSQRNRLCTLMTGSSVESLPDPPNVRH
jgi:tRNA pseudouridine-54 N-methylase